MARSAMKCCFSPVLIVFACFGVTTVGCIRVLPSTAVVPTLAATSAETASSSLSAAEEEAASTQYSDGGPEIVSLDAPSKTITSCRDESESCALLASHGQCVCRPLQIMNESGGLRWYVIPWCPEYMPKYCRATCGFCDTSGSSPSVGVAQPAEASPPSSSSGDSAAAAVLTSSSCVDERENCGLWAQKGECKSNPLYMLANCRHSCGVCPPEDDGCTDHDRRCPAWAHDGKCQKEFTTMLKTCPWSCKLCNYTALQASQGRTPDGECADEENDCNYWAKHGECQDNSPFMLVRCRKSCGVCPSPDSSCKDKGRLCALWADSGECGTNAAFMDVTCPFSCGVCRDT